MACGRLLRDDESKRLRLGPRCAKRLQGLLEPRPRTPRTSDITADQLALDLDEYDEPDEDDWIDDIRLPSPDLGGQGLLASQIRTMTDVPLTGSYL
ncbi:DUF6011 domain-containing protein [Streptomyces sp. NPDC001984]